jgi:hypothetical protein
LPDQFSSGGVQTIDSLLTSHIESAISHARSAALGTDASRTGCGKNRLPDDNSGAGIQTGHRVVGTSLGFGIHPIPVKIHPSASNDRRTMSRITSSMH